VSYFTVMLLPGAEIKPGMFEDTVPAFFERELEAARPLRLVHVDCDIYSSTSTVLCALSAALVWVPSD